MIMINKLLYKKLIIVIKVIMKKLYYINNINKMNYMIIVYKKIHKILIKMITKMITNMITKMITKMITNMSRMNKTLEYSNHNILIK